MPHLPEASSGWLTPVLGPANCNCVLAILFPPKWPPQVKVKAEARGGSRVEPPCWFRMRDSRGPAAFLLPRGASVAHGEAWRLFGPWPRLCSDWLQSCLGTFSWLTSGLLAPPLPRFPTEVSYRGTLQRFSSCSQAIRLSWLKRVCLLGRAFQMTGSPHFRWPYPTRIIDFF